MSKDLILPTNIFMILTVIQNFFLNYNKPGSYGTEVFVNNWVHDDYAIM